MPAISTAPANDASALFNGARRLIKKNLHRKAFQTGGERGAAATQIAAERFLNDQLPVSAGKGKGWSVLA